MTARIIFSIAIFGILNLPVQAQRYFSRNARVAFDATSKTSPEKINAVSNSGTLVLDKTTGKVEAAVLLKGLLFEKALMQEHFNENYVESDKFPKAKFSGKIDNITALDLTKNGTYTVVMAGTMDMHGVVKEVKTPATFVVSGGKITASAQFSLLLADYQIAIPSLVADKVAKTAVIEVKTDLELMK